MLHLSGGLQAVSFCLANVSLDAGPLGLKLGHQHGALALAGKLLGVDALGPCGLAAGLGGLGGCTGGWCLNRRWCGYSRRMLNVVNLASAGGARGGSAS